MKILFISVFSNHFFNWALQLEDSGHELYWLDVNDAETYVNRIDFIHQTVKWKRKLEFPGRQWIKKELPVIANYLNKYNQRNFTDFFLDKLKEIEPDVIHSFEMHSSCVPILDVMTNFPKIKWIYSPWGTDLFYYENDVHRLNGAKAVFDRLDYMFSDCVRDSFIAAKHGFKGVFLGSFPGGGGYDINYYQKFLTNISTRNTILIKGYETMFGRCNIILESLLQIQNETKDYEIIVFGANEKVINFINSSELKYFKNLKIKRRISRDEVFELMGKSAIYIGNSISDGMPNTLLEAFVMEVFPIQSNPGGATAELIENKKNGLLIENPEDSNEIASLIKYAIENPALLKAAVTYNTQYIKPKLERKLVKEQVLEKYTLIEENLELNTK